MSPTEAAYVVGVDAGASHTEAVAAGPDLRDFGRARGPAGNLRPGEMLAAAAAITAVARDAITRAGRRATPDALVVGAAGAGVLTESAVLRERLEHEFHCPVQVLTDGEIALEAAFGEESGVVLAAGSGAIAFARASDGTVRRAGGWGWRIGDEGSGYWIAREAIAAVARAHDGRGPETTLTRALASEAGVTGTVRLLSWAHGADAAAVAALAPRVVGEAACGDSVAQTVLAGAADELADHIRALARWFDRETPIDVAFTGGAVSPGSALRTAVAAAVGRSLPNARVSDRAIDPPLGAAAIAWRVARGLRG